MGVSSLGEKRRYGGSCDDQKLDTNRVALRWDCAMILRTITRLHSFFAFLFFAWRKQTKEQIRPVTYVRE